MNTPGTVTERVLPIRLQPYVYQTRWFLAVCGMLVASGAFGAYRLRVRNIRRQFVAVLEERNRLAREMHDTLIQGCVGVSTLLEAASHAKDVSPEIGHDLVERARAEVRAAVDEARLAVWDLRHGSSTGDRLVPAVSQLANRAGLDAGIAIEVEVSGTPVPVGGETERSLLLLIREALQNAIRHAAPSRLWISLRFDPGQLHVSIQDNGVGFDSSLEQSDESQHYGLVGMRERVEHLGGEFDLTSAPGHGTHVRLRIPLRKALSR
jgi:signal transduction histidine kinase